MGKILREYLKDVRKEFSEDGLVYSPNSIHHGRVQTRMSQFASARLAAEELTDFIDFLFEHSEHCDHISQREAWDEFREFEFKEKLKRETEKQKQVA